uniref:Ubiquitin-like domain-containing protein n=1 Tax=Amphimedon queenslandica TaxID=400682 RepID=A0A1X7TA57_AMPQE
MAVASSSSFSVHLQLVAAALTSLIPGSKVITKDDPLYKTLKDPKPLTYQVMSQNVIVETRPEPDPGLAIPINEASSTATPEKNFITITVQFLNGQFYKFSVDPRATVYGLKWSIFKSKGFDEYSQYDVNNTVLTFGRKELNDDDQLLRDYGIKDGCV